MTITRGQKRFLLCTANWTPSRESVSAVFFRVEKRLDRNEATSNLSAKTLLSAQQSGAVDGPTYAVACSSLSSCSSQSVSFFICCS